MTRHILALPLLMALCAVPVAAQESAATAKPTGADVSIPFANFGGIDDWRADGNRALYIKGRGNKEWYYARLFSPCFDLSFAESIGFENESSGTFDKFSAIIVDGQRCPLTSLVKTDAPPRKGK